MSDPDVVVAVTAGLAIPLRVQMAHKQALYRVLPPSFRPEYVDDDNHARAIRTVLEREMNSTSPRLVVFQDVDCLAPRAAYTRLLADCAGRGLAGIAQAANHISPTQVYVGPAFCMVAPWIWYLAGSPSPRVDARHDVLQRLSEEWPEDPFFYWPVEHSRFGPVWKCGNEHTFGYDTVYDNGVYHAFCIRDGAEREESFLAKCANWGVQ